MTATVSPFPTTTVTPSMTAIPPIPTMTRRPTRTQTATPLATIPLQDKYTAIEDFIVGDDECEFPCVLGMTTGQTSWGEIQQKLEALNVELDVRTYKDEPVRFIARIPFLGDIQDAAYKFNYVYIDASMENGIINTIWIDEKKMIYMTPEVYRKFSLSTVLTQLGVPSEVWISTNSSLGPSSTTLFYSVFIFQEKHIAVGYTTQAHIVGEEVQACLQEYVRLYSWNPTYGRILLQDFVSEDQVRYYRRLEDVTGFSRNEFYEAFRNASTFCINTPTNEWE